MRHTGSNDTTSFKQRLRGASFVSSRELGTSIRSDFNSRLLASMKKLRSSLKPSLKLPHRKRTSNIVVESVPISLDDDPDSLFLLLPTEMRLAVYNHIDLVDQLVLRWTCQGLRDEIAAPASPNFTALSDEDRDALRYRIRLDRFVKLCDQGKDQMPNLTRALCFACLGYHKLNCFFPVTLQEDPRWRMCKKDALLRLCPCLCIERDALANLKNTRIWAYGQTPIDVQHLCGLFNGASNHSSIDLSCASGWWDLVAYLSISYERDAKEDIDSDTAVAAFLVVAAEAKLSLCPHLMCDDEETQKLLRQLYNRSKSRANIPGAVFSCQIKHCGTSITWVVRGTSVSLKVKRQLGDIWKQGSLDNDKWLVQVSCKVHADFFAT